MSCEKMKLELLVVTIILSTISPGNAAITCYVCDSNNGDCSPGTATDCNTGQICMNEVRDENNLFIVRKMCKETDACQNQESQNPSQCHRGEEGVNSLCHYCCETDLCNSGDYLDVTTVASATTHGTTTTLVGSTTQASTPSAQTTTGVDPTTVADAVMSTQATTGGQVTSARVQTTQELVESTAQASTSSAQTTARLDPTTVADSITSTPATTEGRVTSARAETTPELSGSADCLSELKTRCSQFVLTEIHHTVQAVDVTHTFLARTLVVCSLHCVRRSNCGFFAFNNATRQCFLGGGVYGESKLEVQDDSRVFQRF